MFQIQSHNRIEFCCNVCLYQFEGQISIEYAQNEKKQKCYEQPQTIVIYKNMFSLVLFSPDGPSSAAENCVPAQKRCRPFSSVVINSFLINVKSILQSNNQPSVSLNLFFEIFIIFSILLE